MFHQYLMIVIFSYMPMMKKLFKSVSNTASCSVLQRAISSFSQWCSCNKLLINTSKTKVMTYTRKTDFLFSYNINGELLPRVVEVNDLGINFNSKVSFSSHIQVELFDRLALCVAYRRSSRSRILFSSSTQLYVVLSLSTHL